MMIKLLRLPFKELHIIPPFTLCFSIDSIYSFLIHKHRNIYGLPLIYVYPSAIVGSARPIHPAKANIVITYGAISKKICGTLLSSGKFDPTTLKLCAKPKNKAAPIAPNGCHLPKITAAKDINPCPEIVAWEKFIAIVKA